MTNKLMELYILGHTYDLSKSEGIRKLEDYYNESPTDDREDITLILIDELVDSRKYINELSDKMSQIIELAEP